MQRLSVPLWRQTAEDGAYWRTPTCHRLEFVPQIVVKTRARALVTRASVNLVIEIRVRGAFAWVGTTTPTAIAIAVVAGTAGRSAVREGC